MRGDKSRSKDREKSPPQLPERSPPSSASKWERRSRSRKEKRQDRRSRSPIRRGRSRSRKMYESASKHKHKHRSRSADSREDKPGGRSSKKPTGATSRTSKIVIPSTFRADDTFLDSTVIKGYQLPRVVASTAFTESNGTAGMPVQEVPLAAVTYGGLENWGLRYLASGKQGYMVMSRQFREATLLSAFGQACREQDMDTVISAFARANGEPYGTTEEKAEATNKAARAMLEHLQSFGPQREHEKLLKRIAELEAQKQFAPAFPPQPPVQQQQQPVQQPVQAAQKPQAVDPKNSKLPIHRRPEQEKYLTKTAPTSAKVKDVNGWYNGLKLNKDQKAKVTEMIQNIQDEVDGKPITDRGMDCYRACLVDWGLPFGPAAALDSKSIFKMIAAVVCLNP